MKKLLSLSLVASATILSLNASAQDLSEAIKNVDISGTAVYRYNDYSTDNASSSVNNNYKLAVSLKSKVNDDVTLNTRFVATKLSNNDTSANADSNMDVQLSEVNFGYTGIANTSVTVGKQAIDTAFTVARDSIGDEATGTGIVATSTFGPATFTAGYFNQQNFTSTGQDDHQGLSFTGAENVVHAGVAASLGGVNVDASYIDVADKFDAYTVGVDASYKVGDVELSPYARYSSLDEDNVSTDNALWKVGMGAQMGIFGASIGYGETDKEGGDVAIDGSAKVGYDEHWRVTLTGVDDAEVLYVNANAQVTEKVNLFIGYSDMDVNGGTDLEEVFGQVTYTMSSNFSTFVRFGTLDRENSNDDTAGRINIAYTF